MEERDVFRSLRCWLLRKGLGFRPLFWATGTITFFLSPLADNLTSALLMSTVALTVSNGNSKFIVPAFVNIVVAANAGGAWSPFGDITTLMVWTAGKVETLKFAFLMIPSLINWLVPAFIMYPFVPKPPWVIVCFLRLSPPLASHVPTLIKSRTSCSHYEEPKPKGERL